MKHLIDFETYNENLFGHDKFNSDKEESPFLKNYGEEYPMDKINVGMELTYKGTTYYVISNDGKTIELSSVENGTVEHKINNIEFINKCCIRR